MSTTCPSCGSPADALVAIETSTRLALKSTGQGDSVPDQVCQNCYGAIMSQVSQGFKLRQEAETRNKNKVMMWKNRVNLIKSARAHMNNKSYSQAAVSYEKYIRLIEVVYNLERGKLSPAVFSNSARSKEMTVIATVYWDLFRIYDTNPGYGDRMRTAGDKLAQFLPFSPLYPDVIKKAEQFVKSAKNPHIVRQFLKQTKAGKGGCFIATAVFADEPWAWELFVLRQFRDEKLIPHPLGRSVVNIYYRVSPVIADGMRGSPAAQMVWKPLLSAIAHLTRAYLNQSR